MNSERRYFLLGLAAEQLLGVGLPGGKAGGKGEWKGFCSYCGKPGHPPSDCWTKQRDEDSGKETFGAVDDFEHEGHNEEDIRG